MAILGGSPLGLIGVRSIAKPTGMSYFNGGDSRNINVLNYNRATDKYPITNLSDNKYGGVKTEDINEGTRSLFTGPTVISPYANIGKIGSNNGGGIGADPYKGINRRLLHNDQIYDTSLLNILEKLSGTEAALRPGDFAYLKDIGVYPNNRLMIARRFTGPHQDNIFGKGKQGIPLPMAVMISWKPQTEDFLSISFGEQWIDADADFKNVLNSLGNDFMGKTVGDKIGGGLGAIPLPGFTETLQRKLFEKLGVIEDDPRVPLPSGNPNLIKEAKRRKTIGYEGAGSGLKCSVSIKFVCEWEQKFISGIDPTIVWQDLMAKILTFATSRSSNYGLSATFQNSMEKYINDPKLMIKDFIKYIKDGVSSIKQDIEKKIKGLDSKSISKPSTEEASNLLNESLSSINKISNLADEVIGRQVQKYKIELQGIARSLTGLPSTPWHVTIGNPLRPVFCSGDMYMDQDLNLTLGSLLSFNDLPSSIKAEFTLVNARPWGLQEILAKFNSGSIRTSITIKDENDKNIGDADNAIGKMNKKVVENNVTSNTQGLSANNIINNNVAQQNTLSSIAAGPQPELYSVSNNNTISNNNLTGALNNINNTSLTGAGITKESIATEQIVSDATSTIPTI